MRQRDRSGDVANYRLLVAENGLATSTSKTELRLGGCEQLRGAATYDPPSARRTLPVVVVPGILAPRRGDRPQRGLPGLPHARRTVAALVSCVKSLYALTAHRSTEADRHLECGAALPATEGADPSLKAVPMSSFLVPTPAGATYRVANTLLERDGLRSRPHRREALSASGHSGLV